MAYSPDKPPLELKDNPLARYLYEELQRVSNALDGVRRGRGGYVHHKAPKKPREGQWIYADGTDWDPDAGLGPGHRQYGPEGWEHFAPMLGAFLAYQTTTQSIATGTETVMAYNSEQFDYGSYYVPGVPATPTAGLWTPPAGLVIVGAKASVDENATVDESIWITIKKNTTNYIASGHNYFGDYPEPEVDCLVIDIADGNDTYGASIWHSMGANRNLEVNTGSFNYYSNFWGICFGAAR